MPTDEDNDGADAPNSGRKHRRRDVPLVTSEDLASLSEEWAALHAAVPGAAVFSHPDWYHNWMAHFGATAAPVWLSVRVEEALVGVVPLEFVETGARLHGDPNAQDCHGILVRPGAEQAVAEGLLEWLWEDLTESVELWGIPEDSPLRPAFEAAASRLGWGYAEEESKSPRTFILRLTQRR